MSTEAKHSTVLIVDNLELRRAGLYYLVDGWAGRVGLKTRAAGLREVQDGMTELGDVKLILFSIGGITIREPAVQEATQALRNLFPSIPCAIISDRREPDEAIEAAAMGEQAFFSTSMQPEVACQAFTFLLGGGTYFPREALLESAMSRSHRDQAPTKFEGVSDGLTRRQVEVLERLRHGKSNKHIARELSMQESTVKVHVRQIMRKLGAANRTQAALLATAALAHQESTVSLRETEIINAQIAHAVPPPPKLPVQLVVIPSDLMSLPASGHSRPI
ncbi:response regulator transcription factor [Mesorhizobium sp. CAU 1741]|uniref:response regulator transcription factor n=1 Tax=Mesorhizobium sp. CAU 1741 TaxID=3140366 RepID=UPI00325B28F4